MIPMNCPSCGRRGSAPSDRAKVRMNCKKCGAIFYLDETGKTVLGDPEDAARAERLRLARQAAAMPHLNLVAVLKKTPGPVRFLAIASALVLLPFAMGFRIDLFPPPKDREARFDYLARAFLSNSVNSVEKVSAPGTARFAEQWLAAIRAKLQLKDADTNSSATLKPITISDDYDSGRIEIVLRLSDPSSKQRAQPSIGKEPMEPGYNADGTLDVPTVWVLAGRDLWAFEASQSLKLAKGQK